MTHPEGLRESYEESHPEPVAGDVGDRVRRWGRKPFPFGQDRTRPEPVSTADLVAQARERAEWFAEWEWRSAADLLTALAERLDELKDAAAERDRAHATLREIADLHDPHLHDLGTTEALMARIARERLANP